MPWITTCPACGRAYEEISQEAADDPNRRCDTCARWRVVSRHRATGEIRRGIWTDQATAQTLTDTGNEVVPEREHWVEERRIH